jgi:hypothetical protein
MLGLMVIHDMFDLTAAVALQQRHSIKLIRMALNVQKVTEATLYV